MLGTFLPTGLGKTLSLLESGKTLSRAKERLCCCQMMRGIGHQEYCTTAHNGLHTHLQGSQQAGCLLGRRKAGTRRFAFHCK